LLALPIMTSNIIPKGNPPSDEDRIARMYGNRRPLNPVDRFRQAKRKQYFDSGDYAVAQSTKRDTVTPGALSHEHPSPETIPHPVTPTNGSAPSLPKLHSTGSPSQQSPGGAAGSPVKETSFLSHETSADDAETLGVEGEGAEEGGERKEEEKEKGAVKAEATVQTDASAPAAEGELPIRS
jgi:hypothetical protein